MNDSTGTRKSLFVLVVGVLGWGVSTAVLSSLLDWWSTGRVGTLGDLIFRLLTFMAAGILFGFWMWDTRYFQTLLGGDSARGKTLPRTQLVLQAIFFIGVMIGLAFLLWAMASQHR